jgi:hypothetical protein
VLTFLMRSFAFWIGAFLMVFGAIFLAIGWNVVLEERRYQREGRVADGTVLTKAIQRATRRRSSGSRTETQYTVTYRFTAPDGAVHKGTDDVAVTTWERLREMEPVQVQFVASNPLVNRVAGESSEANRYVFPGIGLVAALIGAVLSGRALRSATTKARIWSQGTSADATVAAVEETNVKVNRRPMWVVRYQYRDHSGQTHDGTSEYMEADKANTWKKGDSIRVRFDPEKPRRSVWVG